MLSLLRKHTKHCHSLEATDNRICVDCHQKVAADIVLRPAKVKGIKSLPLDDYTRTLTRKEARHEKWVESGYIKRPLHR